jgi:hypothetical protein
MSGTNLGVMVRLPPPDLDRVDAWRRSQSDLPTRPEAIRRLIELGLERAAERREGER